MPNVIAKSKIRLAHALSLLSLIPLLMGCDKQQAHLKKFVQPLVPAQGYSLPSLVYAENAPVLEASEAPYVEAVWTAGAWHVQPQGKSGTPCRSDEEMRIAIRRLRLPNADQKMLISAESNTAFTQIRTMVRGAAAAGFSRVDFLVATNSRIKANHTLPLHLPPATVPLHPIEPMLVSMDDQGHIWIGSGPHRTLMDKDPHDHSLPKLDHTLGLYASAAKAANCRPFCVLHIDAAASYQRFIDVWSRFHHHQITNVQFTDESFAHETTCEGMNFDRGERMELLKSKPRPAAPGPSARWKADIARSR